MSDTLFTIVDPVDGKSWHDPLPRTTASGSFYLGDTEYNPLIQPLFVTFELNIDRRKTTEFRMVGVIAERSGEEDRVFFVASTDLSSPGAILKKTLVNGFQMTPIKSTPSRFSVFKTAEVEHGHARRISHEQIARDMLFDCIRGLKIATLSDIPDHLRAR